MIYPDASQCRCITQPTEEPVSLAEVKVHLRVEHDDEDALIAALAIAARQRLEDDTRRAFIDQQWRALLIGDVAVGRPIAIPRPMLPTSGTLAVLEYLNTAEVWTEHEAFRIVHDQEPAVLHIREMPSDLLNQPGEPIFRFTWNAGFAADHDFVPGPIKTAILMLTAHLYEHRQLAEQAEVYPVPMSINYLIQSYRVPWLGSI